MTNSVLDGINEIRFNNNSLKYLPGTTNGRAFEGWYLDDLDFRYDAQGGITVPQVTVGSSSDKVSGSYPGTLLLGENLTAEQVSGMIAVTGADSWLSLIHI